MLTGLWLFVACWIILLYIITLLLLAAFYMHVHICEKYHAWLNGRHRWLASAIRRHQKIHIYIKRFTFKSRIIRDNTMMAWTWINGWDDLNDLIGAGDQGEFFCAGKYIWHSSPQIECYYLYMSFLNIL